jgi:RNA polymerase sigma factor (sigma-70 family)
MSPRISIRLLAAQSDQRLVALAREGHERAFEALVHRYRRPLLRYARRMRLSEARAEDVLQQAFMQSWIALSRGVVVQDVRGWLYRIVHNTAVNAMRGPTPPAELTQAVQDRAGVHAASNLDRTIAMRDALGHVAALPDMQRQAIFLTAVDGQSHEEVAGTLGISTGALRGLLYRARHTLRSAAAALTPQPLLELAARGGDAATPGAERALELAGGAGAAGIAGVLLKGGAAAVTAGVLATGAVLAGNGHPASRAHPPRSLVAASASSGRPARSPGSFGVELSSTSRTVSGVRRPHEDVRSRGHRAGERHRPGDAGGEHGLVRFRAEHPPALARERGSAAAQGLERASRDNETTGAAERSGGSGGAGRRAHPGSESGVHTELADVPQSGGAGERSPGSHDDESSGPPRDSEKDGAEWGSAATSREGSPDSSLNPSSADSPAGVGSSGADSSFGEEDGRGKEGDQAASS